MARMTFYVCVFEFLNVLKRTMLHIYLEWVEVTSNQKNSIQQMRRSFKERMRRFVSVAPTPDRLFRLELKTSNQPNSNQPSHRKTSYPLPNIRKTLKTYTVLGSTARSLRTDCANPKESQSRWSSQSRNQVQVASVWLWTKTSWLLRKKNQWLTPPTRVPPSSVLTLISSKTRTLRNFRSLPSSRREISSKNLIILMKHMKQKKRHLR